MTITATIQTIEANDLPEMEAVITARWGRLSKRRDIDSDPGRLVGFWWAEDGEELALPNAAVAQDATLLAIERAAAKAGQLARAQYLADAERRALLA